MLNAELFLNIYQLQDYIARFGHGSAKLARQAQSKEKTLAKMVAGGLTEKVVDDKTVSFHFPSCGPIPPPVIMVQNVSFRYSDTTPWIYRNLEFGIDLDTRLALVNFFFCSISKLQIIKMKIFKGGPEWCW